MLQSKVLNETGALIGAPEFIFDIEHFETQIAQAFDKNGLSDLRVISANLLTEANLQGRERIANYLSKNPYASQKVIESYSYLTDCIVSSAYFVAKKYLHHNPVPARNEKISIECVGGYGRGEMAPFSDVDLLFLTPYKISPWAEQMVETILYILWDVKLKIGHSTRSALECVLLGKSDQTIKTALMESRHLCGDEDLSKHLQKKLWRDLFKAKATYFVDEKF